MAYFTDHIAYPQPGAPRPALGMLLFGILFDARAYSNPWSNARCAYSLTDVTQFTHNVCSECVLSA